VELEYRAAVQNYIAAHGELPPNYIPVGVRPEDVDPPLRSREEEEAEETSTLRGLGAEYKGDDTGWYIVKPKRGK
jgi:hypothetical protein